MSKTDKHFIHLSGSQKFKPRTPLLPPTDMAMVNQILHLTTNLHYAMNHSCFSIIIGERFQVFIFNDLNKHTLSLRCTSKDDDLGGHALPVEANSTSLLRWISEEPHYIGAISTGVRIMVEATTSFGTRMIFFISAVIKQKTALGMQEMMGFTWWIFLITVS